ncbi:MAG: hypothetical protein MUF81_15170 [Verrucomicrobia bacterium]|nr:hypothetical protein [Verrucomicrobiota bacterium]
MPTAPRPPGCTTRSLLGVDYFHLKTSDGGDLYLTRFGLPFWENLLPENWYAREWFESKRERLEGTSTIYKVPTRTVNGRTLNLVAKWSRVGEVVPLDTFTFNKFMNAEFNSPFEEFSLLMELRQGDAGPAGIRIRTQRPMAIYVPSERMRDWQTGRSEDKIRAKVARHPGVEIDILRQYVVLFGWVKGLNAVETAERFGLANRERTEFLAQTTSLVTHELAQKGFRVVDMKPEHVILRPGARKSLLREKTGQFVYALVDYELLERTPEHEQAVRTANRQLYLKHMARRFELKAAQPMPPHLRATNVLGVDYVFGRAESTGGLLWVVGRDPDLFNYFLPERWRRTPKKQLSSRNQIFYTRTKDNINLVWKVSRLGDPPWLTNPEADPRAVQAHGFNSPFEEFSFALELTRKGVKTVYPRAIYMTGRARRNARKPADDRRYAALAGLRTPDGEAAVSQSCDYITIWGFWNGPDELLASQDGQFYQAFNAKHANAHDMISDQLLKELMQARATQLAQCGFEDLNPKPDHLLISFDPAQKLVLDSTGKPEVRRCNFELLRRLPPQS